MLIKLIIFRGVFTLKLRFWAVFKLEMTLSLLHIVNNTSKYTFLPLSQKTCCGPNVQSFTSVPRDLKDVMWMLYHLSYLRDKKWIIKSLVHIPNGKAFPFLFLVCGWKELGKASSATFIHPKLCFKNIKSSFYIFCRGHYVSVSQDRAVKEPIGIFK